MVSAHVPSHFKRALTSSFVSIYVSLSGYFDTYIEGYKKHRLKRQSLSRIPKGTSLPVVLNCHVIRQGYGRTANLLLWRVAGRMVRAATWATFLSAKIAFPPCTGYRPNLQGSAFYEFATATDWLITPQNKLRSLCYLGIRQQQTRKFSPFSNDKMTAVWVFEIKLYYPTRITVFWYDTPCRQVND